MNQTSNNSLVATMGNTDTNHLSIWLNGARVTLSSPALSAVLVQFTPPYAVAINSEFISRQFYSSTQLHNGDKVDIVSPIAGG